MDTSTEFCVMLTSVDSETAAQALASALVDARLAACVQVLPMSSFYVWQGASRRDAEYLLLAKTRTALWAALEHFIHTRHPYELPELLQLPVTAGSAAYLKWLRENTPAPPQE